MCWRRALLGVLVLLLVGTGIAWRYQSRLVGIAARWWLARLAAAEQASGGLDRRRDVVARVNRTLLMAPPADAHVAELFDLVTLVSERVAAGTISLAWAAKLVTDYQRDLAQERPDGTPRRAPAEIADAVGRSLAFYAIRERRDRPGLTVGDLMGAGEDVITLEEIEAADRDGRRLDLRTRRR